MIPKGIVGFSDGVDAHLHGDVWNGRDRVGELLVRSDPHPFVMTATMSNRRAAYCKMSTTSGSIVHSRPSAR